jgi:hypothetical protein
MGLLMPDQLQCTVGPEPFGPFWVSRVEVRPKLSAWEGRDTLSALHSCLLSLETSGTARHLPFRPVAPQQMSRASSISMRGVVPSLAVCCWSCENLIDRDIHVSGSDLVQPVCRCGARVTAPNNYNIRFLWKALPGEVAQETLGGLNPVRFGRVGGWENHIASM